jgi:hypothetical protein
MKSQIEGSLARYTSCLNKNGFHAEGFQGVGTEIVSTSIEVAEKIREKYPQAIFFGGQIASRTKLSSHDSYTISPFSPCSGNFYEKV